MSRRRSAIVVPAVRTRTTTATALSALAEAHGGKLDPETVVDVARDPDHPLHSHFEWDDSKAAHQYRLGQARALIAGQRMYLFMVTSGPLFVHDPTLPTSVGGYVSLIDARQDDGKVMAILAEEVARIAALCERAMRVAASLRSLATVHQTLQAIGAQVVALQSELQGEREHQAA